MSRYRERDNRTSLDAVSIIDITNGDCTHTSDTRPLEFNYPVGRFESMLDVVTPSFHSRMERGEVIVNPLTKIMTESKCSLSTASYTIPATPATDCVYGQVITESTIGLNLRGGPLQHVDVEIDVSRLIQLAGTSASAKVTDPVFHGLVFLAELRETLSFLHNPLKNWNTFLLAVKKAKNVSRFRRAQTVHNYLLQEYLAYRYGVQPLLGDIQDAVKAIHATTKKTPQRFTARGSASGGGTASDTQEYLIGVSPHGVYTDRRTTTRQLNVKCGILYSMSRDPDTFGFSLQQVPSAVWEAAYLSFVIDYFANIGPWIAAITPKVGVNVLGSWTTAQDESYTEGSVAWTVGGVNASGDSRIVSADGATQESLLSVVTRRRPGTSTGLQWRSTPLSVSGGGGELNTQRLLDLWALGTSILSSR